MNKKRSSRALGALTALILFTDLARAGQQASQLTAACASCHEPVGRDGKIPSLAGLDEDHFVALMLAYRSGQRPGQIMQVVAAALTLEEITAIAHHLAAQSMAERRP